MSRSGGGRSVLAVLKKELEDARRQCEDRDALADEVKTLRTTCEDRDLLAKELTSLRTKYAELQNDFERAQKRLESHDEEKREIEHRLKQTDAALKMKVHALGQLNKKLKWEQRALEGQQNKVRDLERHNKKLYAEAQLDRSLREKSETTLENQNLRVARERSLRMLSIHRNTIVSNKLRKDLKEARRMEAKVLDAAAEIENLKKKVKIESAAKSVLQTIVEAHENELRDRDVAAHKAAEKYGALESSVREMLKRDRKWSKRFEELSRKFEILRQRLVQSISKSGGDGGSCAQRGRAPLIGRFGRQSDVSALMDFRAPAALPRPTFPLGSDWGLLSSDDDAVGSIGTSLRPNHYGLRSYMGLTHAFKRKMRGKSPSEIVEIASIEHDMLESKLSEAKDREAKEVAAYEAAEIRREALRRSCEELSLRRDKWIECKSTQEREMQELTEDIFDCRKERTSRDNAFRRRRLREKEEKDPYDAFPRSIVKDRHFPSEDEAATRIQSMYRSHECRATFLAESLAEERRLVESVERVKSDIANRTHPRIVALEEQWSTLNDQLGEASQNAAKLGARAQRTKQNEIPTICKRLKLQASVLHAARRQLRESMKTVDATREDDGVEEGRKPNGEGRDDSPLAIADVTSSTTARSTDSPQTKTRCRRRRSRDVTEALLQSACDKNRRNLSTTSASKRESPVDSKKAIEGIEGDTTAVIVKAAAATRERGWRGGGHGCPRMRTVEGDSRRPCDIPYMFPRLEPPKMRQRRANDALWASLQGDGGTTSRAPSMSRRRPRRGASQNTDDVGYSASLRKDRFIVTREEVQSSLPITTAGSARQVIARVRDLMTRQGSGTKGGGVGERPP